MQHVFIIGSRGLPAQYGGFETFVEHLVTQRISDQITYHVACLSETSHLEHSKYKGVDCFYICPPKLGPARVIAYDIQAICHALNIVKQEKIKEPIFYILGNTIGAFIAPFVWLIHRVGGKVFVNPDGLEWRRSKWSRPVQIYLKYSERLMARYADLLIADNEGIEAYLIANYPGVKTSFIAYGTDMTPTKLTQDSLYVREFFDKWQIKEKHYYLVIGRFVPENNYAAIIREFMTTSTEKDLVIVCNHEGNAYFEQLREETQFDRDPRIKFVGTVYHTELLKYLRREARAYFHGHEVGGTNPGLLEALAQTNENMVLAIDFNQKVALDTVHYWTKESGNLARQIQQLENQTENVLLGEKAKKHIAANYTWERIIRQYEDLFLI